MQSIYQSLKEFVNSHQRTKGAAFSVVNAPLVYRVYDKIYSRQIAKKVKKIKVPPTITIETYNLCNLRCIMCPYKDMTRPKEVMSKELFEKIVLEAKAMGMKNLIITFYSEPFLDPMLFERIKFAKEHGLYVMFFSNGTVMNEGKIKKLLEDPPDKIVFSFDGATKETYEKIRVNSNFERVKGNILNLIEARNEKGMKKPVVDVNCTLQKENFKEAKSFANLWKGKADAFDFGIVDNRESDDHSEGLRVKKSKIVYPCARIWSEIIVLSSGKVALCCVDYDGKVILGDLNKQTLSEVWNGEVFKKIRELHLGNQGDKISLCSNCDKLHRAAQVGWW